MVDNAEFINELKSIVGSRHVLTSGFSTAWFRKGFRFGDGPAIAVVRPGSLVEQWRVLKACINAGKIVIMQAANTGLTGGSTPDGNQYDRDIVIINTLRISGIHLIDGGKQVICLPGATLFELEQILNPLGRNPHSVIGSSCIGASVFGGVCNNSGGSLIRRGPAYTQMTLYGQVNEAGEVELINHLGIQLGEDPETILSKVEKGEFKPKDVEQDSGKVCSDHDYQQHVRDIESAMPARFNADPKRLYESSGSAGKVMVLAVRLDTFPKENRVQVFYIGTNNPDELTELRRHMLAKFKSLPIKGEYLHRDAFNIAEVYGKDTFLAIQYLGTKFLPLLFALKGRFDAFCAHFHFLPFGLSDRIMQMISSLFPRHLPKRLYEYRDRYEHHLILQMAEEGIEEAREYLKAKFPSATGDFFECTKEEGNKAFLHRFAAAGAAVRYRTVHHKQVEEIVALDIALPRNETNWFEHLLENINSQLIHKLYYGHFFCQVFHQDYIVKKGYETTKLEHEICQLLDSRGAEYPAEHNVGHLYFAKPALLEHYRMLDPGNIFNPGVGRTSKYAQWK